jgi:integrase/recombinase XerD
MKEPTTMINHNAQNERLKRGYFIYLKEAKRHDNSTLDGVAKAIHRFESYTKFKDFRSFRIEQAVGFKHHMAEQANQRTGKPLSKATSHQTINALKNFFRWLAGRPGFRSRLSYPDAEYFNLSEKETRIATAHRQGAVPTLEQIHFTLGAMPSGTDIEKRNRALFAFTILTGTRDGATASLKLRHIDIKDGKVFQDARDVNTKFSKTFSTWFFQVGGKAQQILEEWVEFLQVEKLWGLDDPLFPATRVINGDDHAFESAGLDRRHWTNASPIRAIFKAAFTSAGLPYFQPHSFRKTLVKLGQEVCYGPEDFKIWSQNLGHEEVLTTFRSYGQVEPERQANVIKSLGKQNSGSFSRSELPILIERFLSQHNVKI